MNNGEYSATDEKYKYSVKIVAQNITHKQQYIPMTRKNSLSVWSKVVPSCVENYKKKITDTVCESKKSTESEKSTESVESDTQYVVEVDPEVTTRIISQLNADYINMEKGEAISDLGIILVRAKKSSNPAHLFSYYIAMHYFPPKDSSPEQELNSRIRFNKFLSKLTIYYRKRELDDFNQMTLFRQARNVNKGLLCSLKNRPISERISKPTAMVVNVAPIDELKPLFNHLKSNKPLEHNFFDKDRKNMCMKFQRGALYDDGRIDLCKQVVPSDHMKELMECLAHSNKIQHFLLGNNIIGTQGAIAIADYIKSTHNIKTWYLAGNDFDKDGIKYICDALQDDNVCTDLWLKRNPINSGSIHIKHLLEKNKTIDTLDLQNTAIMDGVKDIFEGLKSNISLKILYLDANGITSASAPYIADYFDYLVKNDIYGIDSLFLNINRLEDDGVIQIAQSMSKYRHLKRVDFGANGFTEKAMEYIYHAFKSHPNLLVLNMGPYKSVSDMEEITNCISDSGAEYISKLIKENKVLEYLDITHNGITEKGMSMIIEGLESNDTIIQLSISQYGSVFSQDLMSRLKKKLGENRKRKEIGDFGKYTRFLKHTEKVVNIDSIYRNNSK
jgi:Ran GTPase-activating protein (RanGAP) involved in mRNA processing and transport